MKIAILHYSVPPIVGGVESVIAHHARMLSTNGHSVHLIAGRGEPLNEQVPLTLMPMVDSRHHRVLEAKEELDRGVVSKKFESLRDDIGQELKSALSDMDILIAHNVCSLNKNMALTAALYELHRTRELPRLILWHHDLAWTTPRYQSELHEGYPWELLRTDWGETTHIVVSELRRKELAGLMKLPPSKIKVIPNGVDVARFYKLESMTITLLEETNLLERAPILLLPVRVTPRKNIELALNTLAELKKHYPKAVLVITGPLGPHNVNNLKYFGELSALREKLNLNNSVHFLKELVDSFLPDEVVADFYRVADVLFFPSREEGFGIPLIEAAFSHIPAFCADIPPLRDLGLSEATFFSPDEKPDRIAALLVDYLKHSLTTRLAMRLRTSYRWEAIYHQHIAPLFF
jgi:glycosyltransferase involved in cell wall biosynthesis